MSKKNEIPDVNPGIVVVAFGFGLVRVLATLAIFWHFINTFDVISAFLFALAVKVALDASVFKALSAVSVILIERMKRGEKAIQFSLRVRPKKERIQRKLDKLGGAM